MTGLEPIWIGAAAKGLADIVVKPVSEVLNRRLDEPFQQLLFNVFRKYIQNYTERHGLLKVLGMPEPVRLEEIYTNVQFLGSQSIWQFDPNLLEEAYRESNERRFQSQKCETQDGLKVANTQQYLMVLGQPGAGKSTFLRRIGLEALKGEAGGYKHKCVPVFLELKQFRTGVVNLEQAIVREFETCGFPDPISSTQKLLANGKLLILLDGLDEVPTQQLDIAIDQIQDFADQYKQNRFIASCRTAAYQSRFIKFVDVTMADFDDTQIRQFIRHWFRTEKDMKVDTARRCWELLQEPKHAATKELAQTPLLLTLLCLVFDDTQNFPEKRAELYKQALDVLLSKWAAEKRIQRDPIYKDLSLTLETIMLGEIAYQKFKENRLFFSQQEIVSQIRDFLANNLNAPRHLDGEDVLQAIQIQQGILVERS
jgi:predicted NACHT family NTPase